MRVYIAAPYTNGDTVEHIRAAVFAAEKVFEAGHIPFVPHLFHLWHTISPRPYRDWMKLDLEWLRACDVLIRLPGESSGADEEVEAAYDFGIPVFTLDEFLKAYS